MDELPTKLNPAVMSQSPAVNEMLAPSVKTPVAAQFVFDAWDAEVYSPTYPAEAASLVFVP